MLETPYARLAKLQRGAGLARGHAGAAIPVTRTPLGPSGHTGVRRRVTSGTHAWAKINADKEGTRVAAALSEDKAEIDVKAGEATENGKKTIRLKFGGPMRDG